MARIVDVDQMEPAPEVVGLAARALAEGAVVVMPTDSVYGIGCAATPGNPAHARIFSIKRRRREQTLPWLVADVSALRRYADGLPGWAYALARTLWPGALTLVAHASAAVPAEYVAPDGTIALRVAASPLVCALAEAAGPLAVTSANIHGEAAATSGASVDAALAEAADLVLNAGPAPVGVASTIVAVTGVRPQVLREGAIPTAEVLAAAGMR